MRFSIYPIVGTLFALLAGNAGALAASASNETPVAVSPISFEEVSGTVREASTDGRVYRYLEVSGVAVFSNSCEVPSLIVKEDRAGGRAGAHDYRVLAANPNRMCPDLYLSVSKKFLIDRIAVAEDGNTLAVQVNGKAIHLVSE